MGPFVISDRIALARAIAARTNHASLRCRASVGAGELPFTEEQLSEIRGADCRGISMEARPCTHKRCQLSHCGLSA